MPCLRYKWKPLLRQKIKQMDIVTIKVAHLDLLLSFVDRILLTDATQAPVLTGAYHDRPMI